MSYSEGYSSIASAVNDVTFLDFVNLGLFKSFQLSCECWNWPRPRPVVSAPSFEEFRLPPSFDREFRVPSATGCSNVREHKLLPTKKWVEFVYRKFTNNSKNEGDDSRIRLNINYLFSLFFWPHCRGNLKTNSSVLGGQGLARVECKDVIVDKYEICMHELLNDILHMYTWTFNRVPIKP